MKCDCSKKGCGDIFGFRGFTKENFKVHTAQLAFKVIFACKIVFRNYSQKTELNLQYIGFARGLFVSVGTITQEMSSIQDSTERRTGQSKLYLVSSRKANFFTPTLSEAIRESFLLRVIFNGQSSLLILLTRYCRRKFSRSNFSTAYQNFGVESLMARFKLNLRMKIEVIIKI